MNTSELRRAWHDFFVARDHVVVPSAGLIPHHPTAPMFTNSGMMPFVPYFLGEEKPPYLRATSIQKCVRAGGKHNDLDAIGRSPRHMSFFEMLGNFSFGDYFKREAIVWAWELLTGALGLDAERLWVSVHVTDDEAEALWAEEVGFPRERIVRFDKDNFWEMGDVGPCGPSSEVFFDFGPSAGPDGGPTNPAAADRYVEIWNLVFTELFRHPDGELTELAKKNIDTGAGLERMLCAVNDTANVFDTDVLRRLVQAAQSVTGRSIGQNDRTDVALRLIADHARTMTFLVADGVVPSNEDRGYVLRRIIRRAVRFAQLAGAEREMTPTMVGAVIETMGDAYPELRADGERIADTILREETQFRRTLQRGAAVLEQKLSTLPAGGVLPGDVAFDLYETYGFPVEVTEEAAAWADVSVDRAGYEAALARAQEISRAGTRQSDAYANLTSFQSVLDEFGPTEFVGREDTETKATLLAVVAGEDGTVSIFLDRTPFYAEAGGQVGDTGIISTSTGRAEVLDTTYALPGLHRHVARVVEGTIEASQQATAAIDVERRDAIRRNHTGTHILHWALRRVLGEHVKQQGSLVAPDRLRFDFSHYEALTAEQIRAIEDLANREILANDPVHHYETTKATAEQLGAIAFFGDKYGDVVRVLEAGKHSIELCGGTHVRATGDIGSLKIVAEGSIGSNLRRIEAVTGLGPIERLRGVEELVDEVAELLNVPSGDVVEGARRRVEEVKALREQLEQLRRQVAVANAARLANDAVDGVVVARIDGMDSDALRDLAVAVRDRPGIRAVVVGGAPEGGGAALAAAVTKESGLHAGDLLSPGLPLIRGGGSRTAEVAKAGGKEAAGIDEALALARRAAGTA